MSNIMDTGNYLAARISHERASRKWSLAELAEQSKVSKAMLSKIEREEVSPTATVLARIASAFDMTLAELLTTPRTDDARIRRFAEQPDWTDPATGYRRRQIYLSAHLPVELVEVDLPAGASVSMPAASYLLIRQVLLVMEGRLTVVEGDRRSALMAGDCLEFGAPADCVFQNTSEISCRYLVTVLRR